MYTLGVNAHKIQGGQTTFHRKYSTKQCEIEKRISKYPPEWGTRQMVWTGRQGTKGIAAFKQVKSRVLADFDIL
jgi:hypothetical protein